MNWFLKALKQYADFNGRARRKEFWMFYLFYIISNFVLSFIGGLINFPALVFISFVAFIVPYIAVSVRRMHDLGKSGWWILIGLIPVIGGIWFIVLSATDGESGPNEYGPDPKANGAEIDQIGSE